MNKQILIDALHNLQLENLDWKFALYNTHKGRDGLELDWHSCNMNGIPAWVGNIRDTLLKKSIAERKVEPYSPFLSDKEYIGVLEKTNPIIKDQIHDILVSIRKSGMYPPESFITGALPKIAGFGFYGATKNEEGIIKPHVLFMRRGNPFLSGSDKTRLCISDGNAAVICNKPILKFSPAADFLYINDCCYFLASAIEKDFALDSRQIAIANKCLKQIFKTDIISNYSQLEIAVMKPANAKKFMNFDENILERILKLGILEREEFLAPYGIEIDRKGHMDTVDPIQCDLIIDLLCCRSCFDPLGRLAVADNITPRE